MIKSSSTGVHPEGTSCGSHASHADLSFGFREFSYLRPGYDPENHKVILGGFCRDCF